MANKTLNTRIVTRNDTSANWTTNKTKVLLKGEIGLETDTGKYKIGDGSTTWENLTYYKHVSDGAVFGLVDDVKVDGTSVVSSKIASLSTINGDYDASTNKLATQADLPTDTGATSVGLKSGDTGNAVTNMTYDSTTRKITFEKGETFVKTSDIDSALSTSSTNPVQNKKIAELVPAQASSSNQLADKAFVNSSIATATATFRGTYNVVSDLSLTPTATTSQIATALASAVSTADNNDYCFVQIPTAVGTPTEIARIDRYKYDGTDWSFEYSLNNSGFTASQWEAINSGITGTLVTKLNGIETGAQVNTITGVRGNAESTYRTGNVEIDPDDLDDTSSTNKFVTASDKTTWNGKMDTTNPTGTGSFSLNRKSNTTIGTNSVAIGDFVTASGSYSFAEGQLTVASGLCSHAEGDNSHASGGGSHAEGASTAASGISSHAEGFATTASGESSHAEGEGTIAQRLCQHVFGQYNIADVTGADGSARGSYVEIVGNGTAENVPSNARTLDWNGNEVLSGTLQSTGLKDGNNASYKITLPNTTSWTANQEMLTDGFTFVLDGGNSTT